MSTPCPCETRRLRSWLRRALRLGKHVCQCATCGKWFSCLNPTDNDCGDHNR